MFSANTTLKDIVAYLNGAYVGETLVEKPKDILRSLAIVMNDIEKDLRDQMLVYPHQLWPFSQPGQAWQ